MQKELQKIIGNNLHRLRLAHHLTREEVAEKVGISVTFYANLESGNRMMSVPTLRKVADTFNVSVDSILYEEVHNENLKNIEILLQSQPLEFTSFIEKIVRLIEAEFPTIATNSNSEEGKVADGCKI